MASSEVDQKFLGRLARDVEPDNPLLASILFKILGLSMNLSEHLVQARKRRRETCRTARTMDLYCHIVWLSREGLVLLEQYVLPMVGNYVVLKVLAHKLRASFYHIFVLFHNTPAVSTTFSTPEHHPDASGRQDKGQGLATDADEASPAPPPPTAFLLRPADYLAQAHACFGEAVRLADELLWGSHSLRLSVKTEYAAFLWECVRDAAGSRRVAAAAIDEVYSASEGIDNDMFADACELVAVLDQMKKRGLSAPGDAPAAAASEYAGGGVGPQMAGRGPTGTGTSGAPPGMI